MKIIKKFLVLNLATGLLVTSMASLSFADSPIITSEHGTGIEITNPFNQEQNFKEFYMDTRDTIVGDAVDVLGGKLWATWKDGTMFRANYQHTSKTHKCTALNSLGDTKVSDWQPKGILAQTYYLSQTLYGNRVLADTK